MGQDAGSESVGPLRTLAIDHIRAERWADLVALEPDLRADGEFWSSIWGPACAVARWHCGRANARDLLEECIAAGFYEPDLGTMFERSFGTEPDWPELHARIAASVPPPPVELIRWPCARPVLPLGLARLDETGAARLRARLPEPQASALATAEMLLGWVTSRWRHTSSTHDYSQDANVVLDRVEGGERFACREYTIVLTQALNAVQIPARRITMLRPDYHAGGGPRTRSPRRGSTISANGRCSTGRTAPSGVTRTGYRSAPCSCSAATSAGTGRSFPGPGLISTRATPPRGSGSSAPSR